jgi:hypothetical protein
MLPSSARLLNTQRPFPHSPHLLSLLYTPLAFLRHPIKPSTPSWTSHLPIQLTPNSFALFFTLQSHLARATFSNSGQVNGKQALASSPSSWLFSIFSNGGVGRGIQKALYFNLPWVSFKVLPSLVAVLALPGHSLAPFNTTLCVSLLLSSLA